MKKRKKKSFFSLSNPKELFNKIDFNTLSFEKSSFSSSLEKDFSSNVEHYLLQRGKAYVGEDSCSPHMAPLSSGFFRDFTVLNPFLLKSIFLVVLFFYFIYSKNKDIFFLLHMNIFIQKLFNIVQKK